MRNAANKAFPPVEGEPVPTGYLVVNGFLFLRLFCPAIVAPQLYGLTETDPDLRSSRVLKVIARVLQNLANFKAEVEGESFTPENARAVNQFLKDNQQAMRIFVDGVCSRERATLRVYGRAALPVDLERYASAQPPPAASVASRCAPAGPVRSSVSLVCAGQYACGACRVARRRRHRRELAKLYSFLVRSWKKILPGVAYVPRIPYRSFSLGGGSVRD